MIKLGLIGYPLGHSLSPIIHEAALKSCNLAGSYTLFPIHPDDKQGLKDLLKRVRSGEVHGLNVTIPHKQSVIEFLDELTPTAEAIGAVNTIYLRDHKLIGENTDAPGFLSDLERFLGTKSPGDGDRKALVLGAGGSARAVAYALHTGGWEVTIVARRIQQANQLANSFANHQSSRSISMRPIATYSFSDLRDPSLNLQSLFSNLSLLVNTTPIGMTPNTDQSPWLENLPFPPHVTIYDLVYNPRETKLVRDACAQRLRATTGLGMLIEQAALAFEIWTGCTPSREILFEAFNQPTH